MEDKKELGLFDPFELPNGRKVRFKKPSVGDSEKVNVLSAQYAGQLLREKKLLVRQEVQAMLDEKRDAIAVTRERINQTIDQLASLEQQYEKVEDPEQRERITQEIRKLQIGMFDNISNGYDIYNISVEAQVDRYKNLLLMQLTTLNAEDGSLYWPTMKELENDEDIEGYNIITIRFRELQGIFELTSEERYAMQQLLSNPEGNFGVTEIVNNANSS